MNITFYCADAAAAGAHGCPESVMQSLGIVYSGRVALIAGGVWWFIGCKNIPNELPNYLEVADDQYVDPIVIKRST